jgi:HEAT repeat protein
MDASAVTPATSIPVETREMLERSFQNPHPTVRARAIEAAARLKTAAVLPLLEPLLSDPDPRVSGTATASFEAVISTSDPELPRVFAHLQSPENRARVATLLVQEGSMAGVALVGRLYEAESAPAVRAAMIHAAAAHAGPNASRIVVRALADHDVEVRQGAEILVRQHPEWLRSEAASDALPFLDHAREHAASDAQHAIAAWTDRIRSAQVRQKMHETGMASLLAMTTALRCPSALIRQAAAEACERSGDSRATATLLQALRDKDSEARRAAALALLRLGWKAETEDQYATCLVALHRFTDAGELGPAGVDALLNVVEGGEPDLQADAIACLARTHSIRAMPILAGLLESPNPKVCAAAARALKGLEWVPPTPEAAISHAIALEDWGAAAAAGAPAIRQLMSALKASITDEIRSKAIAAAIGAVDDANAVDPLLDWANDGEVAEAAITGLKRIVGGHVGQIGDESLGKVAALEDATQFAFTVDPRYGRPVRSGFQVIDLEDLRSAAAAELARRTTPPPGGGGAS